MVYGPATIDNLRDSIFSIFSARGNEGNRLSYESVVFLLKCSGKDIKENNVKEVLENMVECGVLQENEGYYLLNQRWYIPSQTSRDKISA